MPSAVRQRCMTTSWSEAHVGASCEAVSNAQERIMEAQEVTPAQLLESLVISFEMMPESESVEGQVNALERQRDSFGPVNLLAESDSK